MILTTTVNDFYGAHDIAQTGTVKERSTPCKTEQQPTTECISTACRVDRRLAKHPMDLYAFDANAT